MPLSKWSRVSECKFHNEKQKLYCQDCNTPICFFCKEYGDHKNHKTDLLETASCNLRDHIASMILKAAQLSERVKGHLIAAERELGVVEQHGNTQLAFANKQFDDLCITLRKRQGEFQALVETAQDKARSSLLDPMQQMSLSLSDLEVRMGQGISLLSSAPHIIVGGAKDLSDALEETIASASRFESFIPDDEEFSVMFDPAVSDILSRHGLLQGLIEGGLPHPLTPALAATTHRKELEELTKRVLESDEREKEATLLLLARTLECDEKHDAIHRLKREMTARDAAWTEMVIGLEQKIEHGPTPKALPPVTSSRLTHAPKRRHVATPSTFTTTVIVPNPTVPTPTPPPRSKERYRFQVGAKVRTLLTFGEWEVLEQLKNKRYTLLYLGGSPNIPPSTLRTFREEDVYVPELLFGESITSPSRRCEKGSSLVWK